MLSKAEQNEIIVQVLTELEHQTKALLGLKRKREKCFPEEKTG